MLLSRLAGLGASLSKFAFDVRISRAPGFGDIAEPFGAKQVGSSAMPFKRNPVMAERIDSLARLLPAYADVAWQNAATNLLERTLDDSANRRTILPEALLCTDEILSLATKIVEGLRIDERRIAENLRTYGPFAGTEAVLMEAAKRGGDRQELHEVIRENAMRAYAALAAASRTRSRTLLADDERIAQWVDPAEVRAQLDPDRRTSATRRNAPAARRRIQRHSARRIGERNDDIKGTRSRAARRRFCSKPRGSRTVLVVQQQDAITAGDGVRRNVIEGKGRIAAQTTARVFRLLNLCGLPTHYINGGEDDDNNEMLVRRAQMIPLEVVVRGVAAGSLVRRRPGDPARRAAGPADDRVLLQGRCEPRSADRAGSDRRARASRRRKRSRR